MDDSSDRLQPASGDLTWGADFRLDDTTSNRREDNGDNILQRGISGEGSSFKAEVDDRRAACAMRGDRGALVIRSPPLVQTRWWYRLRCLRVGDTLMVVVTEYRPDGTERNYARQRSGDVGSLDFDHRDRWPSAAS